MMDEQELNGHDTKKSFLLTLHPGVNLYSVSYYNAGKYDEDLLLLPNDLRPLLVVDDVDVVSRSLLCPLTTVHASTESSSPGRW